jgi:hypothetical protein
MWLKLKELGKPWDLGGSVWLSRFVTTETPIEIEILPIDVFLHDFTFATKGLG